LTGGCSEEGEEGAMGSTAAAAGGVRVGEAMEQLDCSMAGAAGMVALPSAVGDRGVGDLCGRGQLILRSDESGTAEWIRQCLSVELS